MVKKEHLDSNNYEKLYLIKKQMATFVQRDKQQLIEEIINEIEKDDKIDSINIPPQSLQIEDL